MEETTQEYLTPGQVARELRVDAMTVRRWIKSGALQAEAIREGKRTRYRIPRAALEALQYNSKQS